ncbi:hypothetical protein [Arthrobacter sp. Y81]|uniref:hypothetical protein n=1 Tax=Arthrobacter sp. Y81 TaxID=2058897 RepID=UPI0021580AA7|nr:hypothetical protein [Arthrobacter sp. Y81]
MTETIPSMDLFWIVDSRTGARKLLDVEALEIVRVEKIIPAEAVRAENVRADTVRAETAHVEAARTERAVRGERAAPVTRVSRREPHVVWFSSA